MNDRVIDMTDKAIDLNDRPACPEGRALRSAGFPAHAI